MSNQQGNFGFRPVQMLGAAYNGQGQQELSIASNETNSIFQGDPVVLNANGSISRGSTAGAELIGIFNGCFYTDPTTQKPTFSNSYPGSIVASDITAFVVDDPDAVFLMDADAAFTRADLYQNYSATTGGGNTTTGISEVQLDVSVSGTNASFVIQAIDISQDPDNSDTTTANANVLVRINKHFYRNGTGV